MQLRRVNSFHLSACLGVFIFANMLGSYSKAVEPTTETDELDLRKITIPKDAVPRSKGNRSQSALLTELVEYTLAGDHVGSRYYYWNRNPGKRESLAIEATYRDGKLHGYWKHYYRDGKLFLEIPYRKGQIDGVLTYWKRDGTVWSRSRLLKGTGVWTSYTQRWGERIKNVTPYRSGVKHGTVLEYGQSNKDGGIGVNITEYANGMPHGFSRAYDEDGTLRYEGYMVGEMQHGISREWNRDGQLTAGYPKYFLLQERQNKFQSLPPSREVSREEFLKAAEDDPDLQKSLILPGG